jgi:hypothetical protein
MAEVVSFDLRAGLIAHLLDLALRDTERSGLPKLYARSLVSRRRSRRTSEVGDVLGRVRKFPQDGTYPQRKVQVPL